MRKKWLVLVSVLVLFISLGSAGSFGANTLPPQETQEMNLFWEENLTIDPIWVMQDKPPFFTLHLKPGNFGRELILSLPVQELSNRAITTKWFLGRIEADMVISYTKVFLKFGEVRILVPLRVILTFVFDNEEKMALFFGKLATATDRNVLVTVRPDLPPFRIFSITHAELLGRQAGWANSEQEVRLLAR